MRKLGVGVVFASDGGVVCACDVAGVPLLLEEAVCRVVVGMPFAVAVVVVNLLGGGE